MRIVANENLPGHVVDSLKAVGHDVVWVRTEMPGAHDADVIARARAEKRIQLTFDKDFGELEYRSRLPPGSGIILLRLGAESPGSLAKRVATILDSRTDWTGHFSVVEETRIRMRPLPEPPANAAVPDPEDEVS